MKPADLDKLKLTLGIQPRKKKAPRRRQAVNHREPWAGTLGKSAKKPSLEQYDRAR